MKYGMLMVLILSSGVMWAVSDKPKKPKKSKKVPTRHDAFRVAAGQFDRTQSLPQMHHRSPVDTGTVERIWPYDEADEMAVSLQSQSQATTGPAESPQIGYLMPTSDDEMTSRSPGVL